MVQGSNVTAYDVASIAGQTDICEELEAHGYQSLTPPTEVAMVVLIKLIS